ncbi:MAG TPA: hypothetical protein VER04_25985, partial [Polyangiaceae bacterium]|nr:hypothetical protein [Polyangiaceae bacterium]
WELPLATDAQTPIPRAARRFIRTVLTLTETAVDGDALEVRCVSPGAGRQCSSPTGVSRPERARVSLKSRLLGAVAIGFSVASCGGAPLASSGAPRFDLSPVDPVTQAPTTDQEIHNPRLVAPPPAYGNKVVRASTHARGVDS